MNQDITEYQSGYRAAIKDLLRALEEGGVTRLLKWLGDNAAPADRERADAAIKDAAFSRNDTLQPKPILSTGDVSVLTAALQYWLGLGDRRYTDEQYGMLFVRLAKAGKAAFEHEKSANPEETP